MKDNNIIDELIDIDEEIDDSISSIEEVQNDIISQLQNQNILNSELDSTLLDPKSKPFVSIIKDNVTFCVEELKNINDAMEKISNQKNTELFFRKSENIKLLSQYMSKVASVNQKTLDLLILLLGASSRISDEYEMILDTIDELGSMNGNETQVLNYLLKVKKMVNEIHDNDSKMKQLIEDSQKTTDLVNETLEKVTKEVKDNEKSRKIVESKCVKLQKQLKFNNLYIGICLLMIIILSAFIGFKFYVF